MAVVATVAAAFGVTGLTSPAGAAVDPAHGIAALFTVSGLEIDYDPGATVTTSVIRNGVTIGTVTAPVTGAGTLDINPDQCWEGTTPLMLPGDIVQVRGAGNPDDTMVIQDVTVDPPRRDPADPSTILLTGTVRDPAGLPLPAVDVEARIVTTLQGPRARLAAQPGLELGSWVARFTGYNAADQQALLDAPEYRGVYVPGGHAAGIGNEISIALGPAAPGPAAPCTAPLAAHAVTAANPATINAANVGQNLVLSGVASNSSSVTVSLNDTNPATPAITRTVTPTGTGAAQTWSATITGGAGALSDGTLTASATFTVGAATLNGGSLSILKDTGVPAAPTAAPAGGLFNATQNVALSAGPGESIRYTTNGNDPTAASTLYSSPISVPTTRTIKAIAVDAAGNTSPIASFAYTIDTVAPDTTLAGGAAAANVNSASFTFSSDDATATFQCKIDNGAYAGCASPQALSGLADGQHTFSVRAIDSAGNVDASPASKTWSIDTVAPSTKITGHPSGTVRSQSAGFTFESSEAGTFTCRMDGGPWNVCSSPAQYGSLSDGEHTFEVQAHDGSGNEDASPDVRKWTVDMTAPDSGISKGPANNSGVNAVFEFGSSEPGASFECRLGGGPWSPCSSPKSYLNVGPGPHTFEVRATDAVGNVEEAPALHSWSVDGGVGVDGSPVGLEINNGAEFTNDPNVTVRAVPRPGGITGVRLSNTGGFGAINAVTIPVNDSGLYAWKLSETGNERLPKTVYVRFVGPGMDQGETFTDDIILDQTSPTLVSARRLQPGKAQVIAKDGTSGVAAIQVTKDKTKPGAWRPYKRKIKVRKSKVQLFIRVRDGAGNVSKWHKIKPSTKARAVNSPA